VVLSKWRIDRKTKRRKWGESEKKELAKRGEKIENAAEQTLRREWGKRIDLAHRKGGGTRKNELKTKERKKKR